MDLRMDEVAGVRVAHVERPGATTAGLIVRCGIADEAVTQRGFTHLLEHLALFALGEPPYTFNGWVQDRTVTFVATGDPADVRGFVADVTGALAAPPLDRLTHELRVLRAEEEQTGVGIDTTLLGLRYGARGVGGTTLPQYGLLMAEPERVGAFAAQHMVREACCAFWVGPEPVGDLQIALPSGSVPAGVELVRPDDRPSAYWADYGEGAVAVSLVLDWTPTASLVGEIVERAVYRELRRVRGLAYDVMVGLGALDADHLHLIASVICPEGGAPTIRDHLLATIDAVAAGVEEAELDAARESLARLGRDPATADSRAMTAAESVVLGREPMTYAEATRQRAELSGDDVTRFLASALEELILVVPEGCPGPPAGRLERFAPILDGEAPTGVRMRRRGLRDRPEIVIGDEALAVRYPGEGRLVVRYDELVVATEERDGGWTLSDQRMVTCAVAADAFGDTEEVGALLRARIDPSIIVPPWETDAAAQVEARIEPDLGRHVKDVRGEIASLPNLLGAAEVVLRLAVANRGLRLGLLALTDQRLLFVWVDEVFERPLGTVRAASTDGGVMGKRLVLALDTGETERYTSVDPDGAATDLAARIAPLIGYSVSPE